MQYIKQEKERDKGEYFEYDVKEEHLEYEVKEEYFEYEVKKEDWKMKQISYSYNPHSLGLFDCLKVIYQISYTLILHKYINNS